MYEWDLLTPTGSEVSEILKIQVDSDGDYFFTTPSLGVWWWLLKTKNDRLYQIFEQNIKLDYEGWGYTHFPDETFELIEELRDWFHQMEQKVVDLGVGIPLPYYRDGIIKRLSDHQETDS